MIYENIHEGQFISRPNRFVAYVEIDGQAQVCHVKNTGRCAELLIPGTRVWVDQSNNPARKTKYDLVTVDRGGMLINMDSQAPNRLFAQWARAGGVSGLEAIKAESKYRSSRFDFMLTVNGRPRYVEVKGVTLERDGRALFPDAPTQRGVRHISELIQAKKEGIEACIFFVVQMKGPEVFSPNNQTHPDFGRALIEAKAAGVEIMAYDCRIEPDRAFVDAPLSIEL